MATSVSLTRGQVTELSHIAPIKQGTVPGHDSLTYADRLSVVLDAFHAREVQGFPNVIRTFRGIHHASWALIDGDTRLLLNVVFDGDWHDYLRALALQVPGFLHLIWSNCDGWEQVDGKPELLFRFISAYQVRARFFYAHYPELTVPDTEWLTRLRGVVEDRGQAGGDPIRQVEKVLTPISVQDRRVRALGAYEQRKGEGALARAYGVFAQFIGSLYTEDERDAALREAFSDAPAR